MSEEKWITGYTISEEDNTHGFDIPSESGGGGSGGSGVKGVVHINFGDVSDDGEHEQIGTSYSYNDVLELINNGYLVYIDSSIPFEDDRVVAVTYTTTQIYNYGYYAYKDSEAHGYFVNDNCGSHEADSPIIYNMQFQ